MERRTPAGGAETIPGTAGSAPGYATDAGVADRAVGSVIAEDYRIEGRLGVGGMGVVYLARHTKLDRLVAIKELLSVGPEGSERLHREAMAMARMDHPNVVRVFDARRLGDSLFIAMEYLRAGTLQQWCGSGRRTVRQIVEVFAGAADGLAAAHAQGIVHRDFKPQNVLMTEQGRPKVADFGIARAGASQALPRVAPWTAGSADGLSSDLTRTGSLLGTPAYMAPEQYDGNADARSDQFAFCVALYEALYGRRPFAGPTAAELWAQTSQGQILPPTTDSDVPRAVFRVLSRGLSPEPDRRFRNLPSLVRALRRASAPRGPLVAAVTVAALAAVGVVSIVGWSLTRPRAPSPAASGFGELRAEVPGVSIEPQADRPSPRLEPEPHSKLDVPTARPIESGAPSFPKLRTWDVSKPLVCENGRFWYYSMKGEMDEGPMIIAKDGCYFRCSGCELEAQQLVEASGDALLEFTGGVLTAWGTVAKVRGKARLSIEGTTIEAVAGDPAFTVEGEGHLGLLSTDVAAVSCVEVKDTASVTIADTTLLGKKTAIRASENTTVRESSANYVGAKNISGRVEKVGSTASRRRD